ncbi:PREDICTED: chondroitin sulfate synthase 1-like [Branchiostoma belcheri]|uniref:Hexosyltransferase n=1 Tax=Branchiostoma belcheri TaxID=7741 RepID=A0A6P5A448_BRABE|nr:PREDICTED: chondroitin sulfate synthase 1-like [Branchiostoma belcheri]
MKASTWVRGPRRRPRLSSVLRHKCLLPFLSGTIVGIALSTIFILLPFPTYLVSLLAGIDGQNADVTDSGISGELTVRQPLYVGVMTAGKFLHTRATACNNTWGRQVSKVEFFSQRGSWEDDRLPVVSLPGVSDDVYPPQTKAFRMLQHVCRTHGQRYDWFMRADDDSYIHVDRLMRFLAKIDSSKKVYMGQPGYGFPAVRHKLGLNGRNFCMGGPGVMFSRAAIQALCPHLETCMEEVMSAEEDVEIGRCVTNHLHIQCTRAWELSELFYHAYEEEFSEDRPFTGNLQKNRHLVKSLTLHHMKDPHVMYQVHRHFTTAAMNTTEQEIVDLQEALHSINNILPPSLHKPVPSSDQNSPPEEQPLPTKGEDSLPWVSFDATHVFSPEGVAQEMGLPWQQDLREVLESAIATATDQLPEGSKVSHLIGGYRRLHLNFGTEYVIDLAFRDPHGDQVTVRNRVTRPLLPAKVTGHAEHLPPNKSSPHVYIVVPVRQRDPGLQQFLRRYEEVVLSSRPPHRESLILVICTGGAGEDAGKGEEEHDGNVLDAKAVVDFYQRHFPRGQIRSAILDEAFSIRRGHRKGLELLREKSDSIVFLANTDVQFSRDFLTSCRKYAVKGHQVYLPMPGRSGWDVGNHGTAASNHGNSNHGKSNHGNSNHGNHDKGRGRNTGKELLYLPPNVQTGPNVCIYIDDVDKVDLYNFKSNSAKLQLFAAENLDSKRL